MAFRSAACALVVLLALVACAEATYDKSSYKKYDKSYKKYDGYSKHYKEYDEYKECKYKHKGDECYHPDVKDKCLKDAKCEYDEHYHKLKCVPGKSFCYDDECKYAKCYYGKCKYYNKKDYTPCDTDYSKCTVEKCYDGKCKTFKELDCKHDYEDYKHKYDKECIEEEGYCDPKYGCVGPKFKKDGYECGDEHDKCSISKCYKGKCKKVDEKKCDYDYHYDDKCIKKAPYCDPKYGCKEPEYYEKGYDCSDYHDKCSVKECDGYGKCEKVKDKECKFDDYHYDKECVKKEGYCDPKYGCVGPKFYKDGYDCSDEHDKCMVKKCYYGKCKKVYEKKCDDDYHYDDKCVKKAGYCDPKYGCVKAEYYEDGYDCSDEHDKCTVKKCYYGKCKKVEKKKCDDYEHDYDKQCVKKWGYCDPKYGCVETKLYDKGYYCYKYYYGKKYKGYCSEYGKCEVEYHDDKKHDDDKHDDKHDDKYDDDHKEKGKGY